MAIIASIGGGYGWMSRTGGLPDWHATMADTTLHIADALMGLGDDAIKQLRAKLPENIQLLFRGELKAAERFAKDLPEVSDERAEQAEKLLRIMEETSEPPATGPKAVDEKRRANLMRFFKGILPDLQNVLRTEAGRSTWRSNAEFISKFNTGLLTSNEAMRPVADIASTALSSSKDANEVVFQLMDVIVRKCNRMPVDWDDQWWTNQFRTKLGRGKFVWFALDSIWKKAGHGYQIPLDAGPQLVPAFSTGTEFFGPDPRLMTRNNTL